MFARHMAQESATPIPALRYSAPGRRSLFFRTVLKLFGAARAERHAACFAARSVCDDAAIEERALVVAGERPRLCRDDNLKQDKFKT